MSNLLDRTEALSFFNPTSIALSDFKTEFIIDVAVDSQNDDLLFTTNKGNVTKIQRTPAISGNPVYIQSVSRDTEGVFRSHLSNGQVVELTGSNASMFEPVDFQSYVGTGFFSEVDGGTVKFKPMVAGNNVSLDGTHITLPSGKTDMIFSGRIEVIDDPRSLGISAGAWRTRPILSVQTTVSDVALNQNAIFLPEGQYYATLRAATYRNNSTHIRLFDVTNNQLIDYFRGGYSNGGANTTEAHLFYRGKITIPQGGIFIELQQIAQTTYSPGFSVSEPGAIIIFWKLQ